MDFTVDKSGSLAVMIDNNRSVTVTPLTLYQVERFIWKYAPESPDYDEIANPDARITPSRVDASNLLSVFAAGLSYEKASAICGQLLGGRLPSEEEWEYVSGEVLNRKDIYGKAAGFAGSSSKGAMIDMRMARLYSALAASEELRNSVKGLEILVTQYPARPGQPYGQLFVKTGRRTKYYVTGAEYRLPGVCFYAVIEESR